MMTLDDDHQKRIAELKELIENLSEGEPSYQDWLYELETLESDPDELMDDGWISRAYENPRVWMNNEQKRRDDLRRLNDETFTRMSGR